MLAGFVGAVFFCFIFATVRLFFQNFHVGYFHRLPLELVGNINLVAEIVVIFGVVFVSVGLVVEKAETAEQSAEYIAEIAENTAARTRHTDVFGVYFATFLCGLLVFDFIGLYGNYGFYRIAATQTFRALSHIVSAFGTFHCFGSLPCTELTVQNIVPLRRGFVKEN